jgi:ankyrin repeat protein
MSAPREPQVSAAAPSSARVDDEFRDYVFRALDVQQVDFLRRLFEVGVHNALLRDEPRDSTRGDSPGHARFDDGTEERLTPLMRAARTSQKYAIQFLLPISDPHARDAEGKTALMHAAEIGSIEAVRELLAASEVAAVDRFKRSALSYAAGSHSNGEALLALFAATPDARAAIHRPDVSGMTPFLWATTSHGQTIETLIAAAGMGGNAPGGLTPLMLAAVSCNSPAIACLLPHSDANARDEKGRTALHHCLSTALDAHDMSPGAALAKLLGKCDPLALDDEGRDALWFVQRMDYAGHKEIFAPIVAEDYAKAQRAALLAEAHGAPRADGSLVVPARRFPKTL